jgi:hypothetical protein
MRFADAPSAADAEDLGVRCGQEPLYLPENTGLRHFTYSRAFAGGDPVPLKVIVLLALGNRKKYVATLGNIAQHTSTECPLSLSRAQTQNFRFRPASEIRTITTNFERKSWMPAFAGMTGDGGWVRVAALFIAQEKMRFFEKGCPKYDFK